MSDSPHIIEEDDHPLEEKCGIVAIYTKKPSKQLQTALLAASGVQHRGQQGAGVAMSAGRAVTHYKADGLLKEVFTIDVQKKIGKLTQWTMVHCRYGTHGGYLKSNLQPCIISSATEPTISIVHNGEFANTSAIREKLKKKLHPDTSDTYLFAQLLRESTAETLEARIKEVLEFAKGAYSVIIGIDNKIFAARDQSGLKPLVIGKLKGQGWIVASETYSLDKIGAKLVREVKRGEIIMIDRRGLTVLKRATDSVMSHFCDFEWAYFSRPESLLPMGDGTDLKAPWSSVYSFRERCGHVLAREAPRKKATFVVGVPDSGIMFATGYANALGLPYRQVIVRDHTDKHGNQRLFMRDDQKKRIQKRVLGKLSIVPDRTIWENAIVVIGDDSIVRGNVSGKITRAILSLGAKEVHWIIGFPTIMHPCHLGVSIRSYEELIAVKHKADARKIAKELSATSVTYISPKGFISARRADGRVDTSGRKDEIFLRNGGCGGCVTGLYPVDKIGTVYKK